MNRFIAEDTFIIVGIIIAYILFTTWLTFRICSKNSEDFMEGSRAVPAFIIDILLMSEYIGTKSTIGTTQAAFESGTATSWPMLGAAIGFPLFGLILVKHTYNTGKVIIPGAIAEGYSNSAKNVISLTMIYALLLVNVGNCVSGAVAISTVLEVNLPVAVFTVAIVSTFYFAFGSMKDATWVTMLHNALKYAGLPVTLGSALSKIGGSLPMMKKMPDYHWAWNDNIGTDTIFVWFIDTIGSTFCTQFIIQAISSTKNVQSVKRSAWTTFFFCLLIAPAIAIIGIAAKYLYPEIDSLYTLPVSLQDMNPWLADLVTTSLVASIFVSIGTIALAVASPVVKGSYVSWRNPTLDQEFGTTRWASLITDFLPLIFVPLVSEVPEFSFFTHVTRLPITVAAVVAFYAPFFRNARGANADLIDAYVVTFVWYLLGDPSGTNNMYIVLVTPAIIMVIDRLTPNKSQPSPASVKQRRV